MLTKDYRTHFLTKTNLWALFAGIVVFSLNRPEAKTAIGKDMLRDFLETINDDPCANVMMIGSSVPRVFCADADLKFGLKSA
ncbi:LOW QUALITY PROTEIN: hypothetical protein RJ641_035276 [Dillenia turbinata]|uniref:Uncharacterized protein n=1 Tax=Dillenia turbinata TaxID=194707 RepID=A0AAN8VS90_9MAGN